MFIASGVVTGNKLIPQLNLVMLSMKWLAFVEYESDVLNEYIFYFNTKVVGFYKNVYNMIEMRNISLEYYVRLYL